MNQFLNALLSLIIIAFCLLVHWLVPQYLELYIGPGQTLPALTILALDSYQSWWLALAIPAFFQIKLITDPEFNKSKKVTALMIVLIVFLSAAFSLLIFGLYFPVRQLV